MFQLKKRILIVDDEKDSGFTIKAMLEEYGFDVEIYTDPVEALKDFKPDFYGLIILDIKMPEINGFELYNQFKYKDPRIKTLFLTALSDVESYTTESNKVYPARGERHFVKKPISDKELLEQVYTITNLNLS
jgi:two-component system response regulator ChvI